MKGEDVFLHREKKKKNDDTNLHGSWLFWVLAIDGKKEKKKSAKPLKSLENLKQY